MEVLEWERTQFFSTCAEVMALTPYFATRIEPHMEGKRVISP